MKYKFKDILVGFRQEYIETRNKLNDIENKIKIIDQELTKCIVLLDNDNKSINCYFYQKEKYLIDAIISIKKQLNMPKIDLYNLSLDNQVNSLYHFQNNLKHFHIIIENIKEFNDNLLNILNSNFIEIMKSNNLETTYNNKNYTLNYNYNILSQELNDISKNISEINYYPNKDFIKIDYLNVLTKDLLDKELNVLYDSNYFNDYQKYLIENNNKDIILFNDNINNHEFNISEEEKKLVLIKR